MSEKRKHIHDVLNLMALHFEKFQTEERLAVYCRYLEEFPIEKIKELHKKMLVPDLIFILDVSPVISLKRISKRKQLEEVYSALTFISNGITVTDKLVVGQVIGKLEKRKSFIIGTLRIPQ